VYFVYNRFAFVLGKVKLKETDKLIQLSLEEIYSYSVSVQCFNFCFMLNSSNFLTYYACLLYLNDTIVNDKIKTI
jgi:hypothetical protein